jgi:hypothetical protein
LQLKWQIENLLLTFRLQYLLKPLFMRSFALYCLLLICLSNSNALFAQTKIRKNTSLLNFKNLTGWHVDVPEADQNPNIRPSFIIRNGMMVSMGKPEGHLITDQVYQNYRLVVEYRFAGEAGNCGILVHASKPRRLYGMFPQSIEVQMMHQHAGDFWVIGEDIEVKDMEKYRGPREKWGFEEDKNRQIVATSMAEKPLGEWNQTVVECLNGEVKVWVNGQMVNHGFNCTVTKGQIALQAEGAEVEFRKVMISPIKKLSEKLK